MPSGREDTPPIKNEDVMAVAKKKAALMINFMVVGMEMTEKCVIVL